MRYNDDAAPFGAFDMAIDSMMSMVESVPAKFGWPDRQEIEPSTMGRVEELESRCDDESTADGFSARSIVEIRSNHSDDGWETKYSASRGTVDEGKSTCSTVETNPKYLVKYSGASRKWVTKRLKKDSASRDPAEKSKTSLRTKSSSKSKPSTVLKPGSNAHLDDLSKDGESTVGKEGMRFIAQLETQEESDEEASNALHSTEEEEREKEEERKEEEDDEEESYDEEEEEESDDEVSTLVEDRTVAKSEHEIPFSDDSSLSSDKKKEEYSHYDEMINDASILASFSNDSTLSTRQSRFFSKLDVQNYRKTDREEHLSIIASISDDSTLSTKKSRFFQKSDIQENRVSKEDCLSGIQENQQLVAPKKKRIHKLARSFGRIFSRRHRQQESGQVGSFGIVRPQDQVQRPS
jgi:hypothetical protein